MKRRRTKTVSLELKHNGGQPWSDRQADGRGQSTRERARKPQVHGKQLRTHRERGKVRLFRVIPKSRETSSGE